MEQDLYAGPASGVQGIVSMMWKRPSTSRFSNDISWRKIVLRKSKSHEGHYEKFCRPFPSM